MGWLPVKHEGENVHKWHRGKRRPADPCPALAGGQIVGQVPGSGTGLGRL